MDRTLSKDSGTESVFNQFAADSLLRLDRSELLVGMYVCEVDCAWSVLPFPMGGFHLKTADDIETLSRYCKFVSIDTNRGTAPRRARLNQLTILSNARSTIPALEAMQVKRNTYPVLHPVEQHIEKAYRLYSNLKREFLEEAQGIRVASELDLVRLQKSIDGLIEEVLGNPQTLIWVLNTDPDEPQETDYCVRASIWAAILARQFGLRKTEIQTLFMGTLLADIGMQALPQKLLSKRGSFRKKEFLAYKKHVELGMELVTSKTTLDSKVTGIIRCHHERHDGMGFPRGLQGEQIPQLARFANLAYSFERVLKPNTEGLPVSPAKALSKIYKQRGLKFPEQLVVELIQVMGVYPLGSLVELSSGEVALVLAQTADYKLLPKVALLTDKNKSPSRQFKVLELNASNKKSGRAVRGRSIVGSFTDAELGNRQGLAAYLMPNKYTFSFYEKRSRFGSLLGLRR